tara:strand:- start:348 stop:743 length:396 start_codon:yes stop_codon:yes gene_type:complete
MTLNIKKKKKSKELVNLIPMINLVFLLLIFFLLTGVVSQKDPIEISKPNSIFGEKNSIKKETNIFVTKENDIFLNTKRIKIESLNNFLAKDDRVILVIDKNSKISNFNKIIKIFNDIEIDRVLIKVKKRDG